MLGAESVYTYYFGIGLACSEVFHTHGKRLPLIADV